MSFFNKLKEKIKSFSVKKDVYTSKDLEEIEDILIEADFGADLSSKITNLLKKSKDLNQGLIDAIEDILKPYVSSLDKINISEKPYVIMFVGVNGSGKTTSVAKVAHFFKKKKNLSVDIVACDTFRVAATEQLEFWANNLDCTIYKGTQNSDPASVAFDAVKNTKSDVLLIDTAGRLHNNVNLMNELSKISNVLRKIDENAPQKTIITIDATTGQHAIEQVRQFSKFCPVNGVILTKMDGNASGGAIVRITEEFKLPVFAVGIGEKPEDLEDFSTQKFIDGLR